MHQWLRLWMLGESAIPRSNSHKHKGRFGSKVEYYNLLDNIFGYCSQIMDPERSTIYVRTDVREYTFNTTLEILKTFSIAYCNNKNSLLKRRLKQNFMAILQKKIAKWI